MAKKLRRGNREGSISQRPDGRWVARVSLGYKNGKLQRKAYYGATRDEARDKLTAAMRSHQLGIALPNERKTVGEFLTAWLETIEGKVRYSTYRSYEGICRNHLTPGLGRYPLVKLSPPQIAQFLKERHDSGRVQPKEIKKEEERVKAPAEKKTWKNHVPKPKPVKKQQPKGVSAEHIRRVLRAALNQAVKWDLVPRNVASLASAPKSTKHEIRFLDPDQAKAFLKAVKDTPHEALFTVAIAVGLRLGEALGLRWSDINLPEGMLTVRRQCQRVKGKLMFTEPKTAKARRSVPLPAFAVDSLRQHWTTQQFITRVEAKDRWQETNQVFTSEIGTPLDERNVRRALAKILEASELPPLRFHDLRHSCATLLLSQGCDPRTIMETLGHSQITLTLNTYSHVIPALQRDAADKMQAMIASNALKA